MTPPLGELPDGWVKERIFSPDRRLALDSLPYPDPRSQFEREAPEYIALRDARTGVELGRFGGWTMPAGHRFPEAGGVELDLPRDLRLVVAPDLATFTASDSPGTARPIAALPAWLRDQIPPPPPPLPPPSALTRLAMVAGVIALIVLIAFGLSRLAPVRDVIAFVRGDPAPRTERDVNAWIVRCPDVGLAPMHLDSAGALVVPPAIAPAPLPPLDSGGTSFGAGGVVVEIDGRDVTWWPQGLEGKPVACPSTSAD